MSSSYDGFFEPTSVTWRLHADPLMLVSGLRAVFLQALHPTAMTAVDQHSSYRADPWGRFQRTGAYLATVTYGTRRAAEHASAGVRAMHRRVRGVDPATGRDYRADDPDLLLWVHCGFVESNLSVARRGGFPLAVGDGDTYVREQVVAAQLVGLEPAIVPASEAALQAYYERVRPQLQITEAARRLPAYGLLPPMRLEVELATPARPLWASAVALAYAMLPGWARILYGLPNPLGSDAAATLVLRGVRASLLALPPAVREGPHLRAARARLARTG